jgi:hypothetical protein
LLLTASPTNLVVTTQGDDKHGQAATQQSALIREIQAEKDATAKEIVDVSRQAGQGHGAYIYARKSKNGKPKSVALMLPSAGQGKEDGRRARRCG